MNGSVTKWKQTSVAGKYEKCSNGSISNGNVYYQDIVNVSSIHTMITTTQNTLTKMTLDGKTTEETFTENFESKENDMGTQETHEKHVESKVGVNCDDIKGDNSDKSDDSDSEEEHNSKGKTKSFLDGLKICQYKLK